MDDIVIIGNKTYLSIDLNGLIDSFDNNIRFNMGIPCGNNGTVKDKIALCCHIYDSYVKTKKDYSFIENIYGKEYKLDFLKNFYDSFDVNDYKEIIPPISNIHYSSKYNAHLLSIGCPYTFSKQPRTGHSIILDQVIKNENQIYVIGCSITNETRKTYYVNDFVFERENEPDNGLTGTGSTCCHNKNDEIKILRWLHENSLIDATLCMLKDSETPTLETGGLEPSQKMVSLIEHNYGAVIV